MSGPISYAYNSRTEVMIYTKFSGSKHQTITYLVEKVHFPEVVPVETVTNRFSFKSTL